MRKADAEEAAPILQGALQALLAAIPPKGPAASNLRTACGQLIANAEALIQADQAGPPLIKCFDLAVAAGATQPQLASLCSQVLAETPVSDGANMIRDSIVGTCLAAEGTVIADMTFASRQDVEALMVQMNAVFAQVEEISADAMDQASYMAAVQLHAAMIYHLTQTARPLPRMIAFAFAAIMPTLTVAQRLYYDASRADELRDENKVVHPAFMPPIGRALSA